MMSEIKKSRKIPSKALRNAVASTLEAGLKRLESSKSSSMLKRFFTKEILEKLKKLMTSYGATLVDCINSGIENLDLVIGIYAADPDCYEVFKDLFNPIIEECHRIEKTAIHPRTNWGMVTELRDLDLQKEYIICTGVKCSRNLKGYPFSVFMTEANYEEIEYKLSKSLRSLSGELRGNYHSLAGMSKTAQQNFIGEHYFKEGKRYLQSAISDQFWPTGRGVYLNFRKTFVLWIGEEDHVTIMSMQQGGNVAEVFKRLIMALGHIQRTMEFSTSERLGYLTSCPSILGHALRTYFKIKVPKLAADMPKLQELAANYEMQVKEAAREPTNFEGIYELSNAKFFGCTEYDCLKKMYLGIKEIIEAEKKSPNLNISKKKAYKSKAGDF